jgi:hypothetical protein
MNAAGRALALDPESAEAAQLVSTLMLEAPKQMPAELAARVDASERALVRQQARISTLAVLAVFIILPVTLWMGVRDPLMVGGAFGLVGGISTLTWRAGHSEHPRLGLAVALWILLMMVFTRWVGPFLCVPGLICAVFVALLSFPTLLQRWLLIMSGMIAGLVVPLVLEAIGVLSKTWDIEPGSIVMHSAALDIHGSSAVVFLLVSNVGMIVVLGLFARSLALRSREANRRLEQHAWHLSHLLPAS